MGFGMLPFLFNLNFSSVDSFFRGSGNLNNNSPNNTAETDFQKFARIFLFFVMICFSLFGGDVFMII